MKPITLLLTLKINVHPLKVFGLLEIAPMDSIIKIISLQVML
jgi:hypothetical protein